MRSLAFLALTACATAAMAVTPLDPEITVTGTSSQTASLNGTVVNNTSIGNTEAHQNLASNAGNVTIRGTSSQTVTANGGNVNNTATGGSDAYASQNLSANVGKVDIDGYSVQSTYLANASVNNLASGSMSKAVQNIASNNACFTCQSSQRDEHHDNH